MQQQSKPVRKGVALALIGTGQKFCPIDGSTLLALRDVPGRKYLVKRRGFVVPLERPVPLGMKRELILDGPIVVRPVKPAEWVDVDCGQRPYDVAEVFDKKPRRPQECRVRISGGLVEVKVGRLYADVYAGERLQVRLEASAYSQGVFQIPEGEIVRQGENILINEHLHPVWRPIYSHVSNGRDYLEQQKREDQLAAEDPLSILFPRLERSLNDPIEGPLPVLAGKGAEGPRVLWAVASADAILDAIEEPTAAFQRRFSKAAAEDGVAIHPARSGMVYKVEKTADPGLNRLVDEKGRTLLLMTQDGEGNLLFHAGLEDSLNVDEPVHRFVDPGRSQSFDRLRDRLTEADAYEAAALSWALSFCDYVPKPDKNGLQEGTWYVPNWMITPKFRQHGTPVLDVRFVPTLRSINPAVDAELRTMGLLSQVQEVWFYPRGYLPEAAEWSFAGVDLSSLIEDPVSPEGHREKIRTQSGVVLTATS
jgi:hypothetical protein